MTREDTAGSGSGSRARRVAVIVGCVGVTVVIAAGATWLAQGHRRSARVATRPRIEPAQVTTPVTVTPAPATGTSEAATPTTPPPAAPADADDGVARAARIAFRLNTTVYVANEDGTLASPVARVAEGPYALSPDGLTLAVVHDGRLTLYDASTGGAVEAGSATDAEPVWFPDSSAVLFVRAGSGARGVSEVWRVTRDGSGGRMLARGSSAAISPDGHVVAVVAPDSASGARGKAVVRVSRNGGAWRTIRISGCSPTVVEAGDDRIYAAGVTSAGSASRLYSVRLDGSQCSALAVAPATDGPVAWGRLCLSSDGAHLACARVGDDDYSRVCIYDLRAGSVVPVNLRRDCSIRSWDSAGTRLLLIEGNAYQGEPTALVSVDARGRSRRAIVTGAR